MIIGFRHKGLERLYEEGDWSGIAFAYRKKISRILFALDAAEHPEDVALAGFRLHPLRGDLDSFWSVRVSANWRIIFRMHDGDVLDVDLVDYH